MEKISISLTDEQIQAVGELTEEQGNGRSEAVRTLVERGRNYSEVEEEAQEKIEEKRQEWSETVENLEAEIGERNREIERLTRERRQLLEQREENRDLVRFAEEQRSLVADERRRRSANVFRRTWWRIAGEPFDERNES